MTELFYDLNWDQPVGPRTSTRRGRGPRGRDHGRPGSDPVITVADAELAELRNRLAATRWPQPYPGTAPGDWTGGTAVDELRRLASYWAAATTGAGTKPRSTLCPGGQRTWPERSLAGASQPVSYLRFDAEQGGNLPLVLTNGWPSSFLELVGLARRLSTPSRWGGDPGGAFTVIVPCLPGFPFSPQPPALPARCPRTSCGIG